MALVEVKEVSVSPGMEYQIQSYPGAGVYLVNGRTLAYATVMGGVLSLGQIDSAHLKVVRGVEGASGVSPDFVFALINRTVELVEKIPTRQVRVGDRSTEKGGA